MCKDNETKEESLEKENIEYVREEILEFIQDCIQDVKTAIEMLKTDKEICLRFMKHKHMTKEGIASFQTLVEEIDERIEHGNKILRTSDKIISSFTKSRNKDLTAEEFREHFIWVMEVTLYLIGVGGNDLNLTGINFD